MQEIYKVLITGTSRGLGQHLVNNLLQKFPEIEIYALARENAEKANKKWNNNKIKCFRFALGDRESYIEMEKYFLINSIFFNAIVNNAAVLGDKDPSILTFEGAKEALSINVVETMEFTKRMIQFLTPNGRIINVSSKMGALNVHPEHTTKKYFREGITEENITEAIEQYLNDVTNEKHQLNEGGRTSFPSYRASKMLLNCWSKYILQKKLLKEKQVAICMSPGHCRTDMGGEEAANSAEYGAACIALCLTMKEPSADYFYHQKIISDYETCGENFIAQIVE